MKTLFSILIGILTFIGIFYLDYLLINWIMLCLPKSAVEWFGIIKVILWIFAVLWTTGIAFLLGIVIATLCKTILNE